MRDPSSYSDAELRDLFKCARCSAPPVGVLDIARIVICKECALDETKPPVPDVYDSRVIDDYVKACMNWVGKPEELIKVNFHQHNRQTWYLVRKLATE